MSHIVLVHWKESEAEERAAGLRSAGHRVDLFCRQNDLVGLRRLRDSPPDAVVVDLGRLPSHGREVGAWLRRGKTSRHVPLVFVGGKSDKVAETRKLLPDATFAAWDEAAAAVAGALARPVQDPVVPGTMDGYSGTPLPKKLGVKAGSTLALLGAPDDFEDTLGSLPEGVRIRRSARGRAELVLLFAETQAELRKRFPAAERTMADGGGLWIVWPKKSSGRSKDLGEAEVRRFGLDAGLVDYKICAVDKVWSGLKFARRA